MGLDIDRHDEIPLQTATACSADDRAAAAAYIRRHANDDADQAVLLAALGLDDNLDGS